MNPRGDLLDRKRVLLVDNVDLFVDLGMTFLSRGEFEILTAASGREALKLARSQRPDFILLNQHLPDMNGGDVFRRLRADPSTSHIPVVICSPETESEAMAASREAGPDGHPASPLRGDALMAEIQKHLGVSSRSRPRIPTRLACRVEHRGDSENGVVSSLSPSGAFIEMKQLTPLDEIVEVILTLPQIPVPLNLKAVTRWWCIGDEEASGIGVEFEKPGKAQSKALSDYLEKTGETTPGAE